MKKSRPARALWIEIIKVAASSAASSASRPARALWIEIILYTVHHPQKSGRGPRGPCGLKWSTPDSFEWCFDVEAREGLVD